MDSALELFFLEQLDERKGEIRSKQNCKLFKVKKQAAWEELTALVNSRSPVVQYTVKSLKKKWENIQLRMQDQVLIGSITASDRIHPARSSRVQ